MNKKHKTHLLYFTAAASFIVKNKNHQTFRKMTYAGDIMTHRPYKTDGTFY